MDHFYLTPRARTTILWAAVGLMLLFLWQVRGLLAPLVWAAITVYLLNPPVEWLAKRTAVSRRVWAVAVFVGLAGLVGAALWAIVPEVRAQAESFVRDLPRHFRELGGLLGQERVQLLGVTVDLGAPDEQIRERLGVLGGQVGQVVGLTALPYVADGAFKFLLFLVSAFFLLLDAPRIGETLSRYTPAALREELAPWLGRVNMMLGSYVRGQAILFVLMSAVCYIALEALGVRFAPLLAVFSGFVLLIPYIGPYIAGGAATLVALTQGSAPYGWSPVVLAIVVAVTYTVLRQLEANLVMPFLIGKLVKLHPLTVIFVVLAGAIIGGVLGLLVAVPVATTVKIAIEYLYEKLRRDPPRVLVMLEPGDSWTDIARSMREGAAEAREKGMGRPRLTVSAPDPPVILLDSYGFHRFSALIQETESDTILITPDIALIELARGAGIAAALPDDKIETIEKRELSDLSSKQLENTVLNPMPDTARRSTPRVEAREETGA